MFESIIEFIKSIYPGFVPIPLHAPVFAGNEKKYLADCIDTTFVSSVGRYVDRFEQMVCEITGSQYAVATVNGTNALHIALLLSGVKAGDLVITTPLSFVATANAIAYIGAEPVFLDVDKSTLGLSPDSLKSFLQADTEIKDSQCYHKDKQRRIAACIPVHAFGHPCRIDAIVSICDRFNIPVVEDAAESLGSLYKGKHTGRFGLFGIISFNGNKIATCGGGGAILTDDSELAGRAKHITTTAKIPHRYEYFHDETGYNFRMPNINAALACAQLEQLKSFVARKRNIADKYARFFDSMGVLFIKEQEHCRSNYWLNSILMEDKQKRDEFLETTNNADVMTRPAWRLLCRLPMYTHCHTDSLQNAQWLEDRLVNIPSSVTPCRK